LLKNIDGKKTEKEINKEQEEFMIIKDIDK
jgi:hypothetical protein